LVSGGEVGAWRVFRFRSSNPPPTSYKGSRCTGKKKRIGKSILAKTFGEQPRQRKSNENTKKKIVAKRLRSKR